MINLLHEATKAQTSMLQETQSTQTNRLKKSYRNGRSKMPSKQPKSAKDGVLPISMITPWDKVLYGPESTLGTETMSSVHGYAPKIPQVSRPFREYNSPERVPHSTQTPQERSYVSSPRRDYSLPASERNFNLSTQLTSELPKRPITSLSPMRYLFLLLNAYSAEKYTM
jgi:hypothetical protein